MSKEVQKYQRTLSDINSKQQNCKLIALSACDSIIKHRTHTAGSAVALSDYKQSLSNYILDSIVCLGNLQHEVVKLNIDPTY